MANDKNKVLFGICNLHIGTYTVNTESGAVTLGTPYHQAGAKSFAPEPEEEQGEFYADNVKYWSGFADNGYSGTLEVAKFDDEFKTKFLGYEALDDGGLAKIKGKTRPDVYIAFECEGDAEKRRVIYYNCTLSGIKTSYETIEGKKEPKTESLSVTVIGDNATGVIDVAYKPDDTGYSTLFTNPPTPSVG